MLKVKHYSEKPKQRSINRNFILGYAIYEVLGNSERSLAAEEKVADVMAKWERYRAASAANATSNTGTAKRTRPQHHFFLFKKHLFLDNFINLDDNVEKELLYHQVLHDLRADRFPVTDKEAVSIFFCGTSLFTVFIIVILLILKYICRCILKFQHITTKFLHILFHK